MMEVEMPLLKNAKHEAFAQLVARGSEKTKAYATVFPGSAKWKPNNLRVRAHRLSSEVSSRIAELQEIGERATIAGRVELAEFLTSIIRTPIGEVNEKSPLAQELTTRRSGKDETVETVKLPDKLAAVAQLSKMMGYNEPEKQEQTHRFEVDLLVQRRFAEVADGG